MVIEQGWSVVDSEGEDVGRIDEVLGDEEADIFNGLTSSRERSARRPTSGRGRRRDRRGTRSVDADEDQFSYGAETVSVTVVFVVFVTGPGSVARSLYERLPHTVVESDPPDARV